MFSPETGFQRLQHNHSIIAPALYSLTIVSSILVAFWIATHLIWSGFNSTLWQEITGGDPVADLFAQGVVNAAANDPEYGALVRVYRGIPGYVTVIALVGAFAYMLLNMARTLLTHHFLVRFGATSPSLTATIRVALYSSTPNILVLVLLLVVTLEFLGFSVRGSESEPIVGQFLVGVLLVGWFCWTFLLETLGYRRVYRMESANAGLAVGIPHFAGLVALGSLVFIFILLLGSVAAKSASVLGPSHQPRGGVDPSMATARMIVKLNPDLEEVAVDSDAGTITVRNTKTGEVVAVDFDDIEQGRISFKSGDREIMVDASEAGETGTVKVTDDEGGVIFSAGEISASDLPPWVPVYPGTEPASRHSMKTETTVSGGFELETTDPVDQVLEHYRSALAAEGYELNVNTYTQDDTRGGMVNGTHEADRRNVVVIVNADAGGPTKIVVTYNQGS